MNSHFIPAVTGQLEENTVVFFAIISPSFLFIYLFISTWNMVWDCWAEMNTGNVYIGKW